MITMMMMAAAELTAVELALATPRVTAANTAHAPPASSLRPQAARESGLGSYIIPLSMKIVKY